MRPRCGGKDHTPASHGDPCHPPEPPTGTPPTRSESRGERVSGILERFANMIPNCLSHAERERSQGRPIVGILCEYTPRELIMAAGGVPVCLCGGSLEMIAPAEEHLPSGLCPLIKSTYGFHLEKENPFLEMADLVVGETTCDGKKKMYELMGRTRSLYVIELPQKQEQQAGSAFEHWLAELRKFRAFLSERYHCTLADDDLRAAIRLMNQERALRREVAALMKAERPPLTGREVLDLKSNISCIPCDLTAYRLLVNELRAAEGPPDRTSKVRVLLTGVPLVHGAERVMDLIEGHGGLVVCAENCTGIKPILEDVDALAPDPLHAIAEKYLHLPCSVMTPNVRRLDELRQLAREYRAQCVIEVIWQGCLTYEVESYFVRELAENELQLPYLRIETDYSPADSARIAVRVEALFETVSRRGSPCPT
ncbi:MAG: double-cubane-cluster-containing anaerobic reductase [Planctomycetota bacterium]